MSNQSQQVKTRIAPSPTGYLHVGTARSALFNYLFARQHSGQFIVRIEDTDRERSDPKLEEDILNGLQWLELRHDALYRQSERAAVYRSYLEYMVEQGSAYTSYEESKARPGEMTTVVRLKNPNEEITFQDQIRGNVTFDTTELGDFVIARSIDEPLYHLAVVVDDHEMAITHVIRGEDHVSNTPRQILIQRALNISTPTYAHIPLILAPDRSRLSKRHGAVALSTYRERGYLPEAMRNYLALLGWSPGDDRELLSLPELIDEFSLEGIQRSGAVFDLDKLNWFNREYLKQLSDETFYNSVYAFVPSWLFALPQFSHERLRQVMPHVRDRIAALADVADMAENGELTFYFQRPSYEPDALRWKHEPDLHNTHTYLTRTVELLQDVPNNAFTGDSIKEALWDYASEQGRGSVLWPVRYALTGLDKSPDPFAVSAVLGKDETLARLNHAISLIEQHHASH
jgi:glutamyl-tRNA synthetase